MEAQCSFGQIRFRGFGESFKPALIFKTFGKPVSRDPVLGFDHSPSLAAITAQLRRERGGRPYNRTR